MNLTTFTNNPTPDRGADFDYGDGTYCRVCITLDSDPASTDPSVRYLAQAFQVDANGDFVLDAAGAPITHGEREVKPVMKSGLISVPPQYTMKAGWVAYQPQQGGTIVRRQAFPDHAPYTPDTVMRLTEEAHKLDAIPVTTAKDHVRLPAEARPMAEALRVRLRFDDPEAVTRFLLERLARV